MVYKGERYTHYRNRRVYEVIDILPYLSQYKGEWFPTVMYKDVETNKIYLRATKDFEEHFEGKGSYF